MQTKIRKCIASFAAAALLCGSMGTTAAAEQDMLELVVSDISVSRAFGENIFRANINGEEKTVRIDGEDIANLRETGELTYDEIAVPDAFKDTGWGLYNNQLFRGGGYGQAVTRDDSNTVTGEYFVHLNNDENKIEVVDEAPADAYVMISSDGYIASSEISQNDEGLYTLTFNIEAPDGTVNSATVSDIVSYHYYLFSHNADRIAMIACEPPSAEHISYLESEFDVSRDDILNDDTHYFNSVYLYFIDKNGEIEKTAIPYVTGFYSNELCAGDNYFHAELKQTFIAQNYSYLYDSGEAYRKVDYYSTISDAAKEQSLTVRRIAISSFGTRAYGTRAIAEFTVTEVDPIDYYALVDLESGAVLSDIYTSMSTNDGKRYLVQTLDGKWGYLNTKGQLLKTFDEADDFHGDYAPVIKDGKAFLIDRSMNRVSEMIDAEAVLTGISENVFAVRIDDKDYFMTYKAAEASPEQPAEPTEEPEAPAEPTEEPADPTVEPEIPAEPTEEPTAPEPPEDTAPAQPDASDTAAPDKTSPETGLGFTAIPVLLLGAGAMILSRRKK